MSEKQYLINQLSEVLESRILMYLGDSYKDNYNLAHKVVDLTTAVHAYLWVVRGLEGHPLKVLILESVIDPKLEEHRQRYQEEEI